MEFKFGLWKAALLLLTFYLLISLSPGPLAAQEQRIRIGYSAMAGPMAWVWTAKEAGYFDRQGLRADIVYVGGTAQLFQAMLAGEVVFGVGGGPAIIHASLQRRSLVGIVGTLNRMVMKVMGAPQIKTASDLRGKKIGITRYGTITDFSARLFLKKSGLSPEKDTSVLQVGSIPNVLAALQNGTTQAGVLSPPAHLQAQKLGFSELMDLSKEEIYYPYTYVVTPVDFLEKNSKTVTSFVAAAIEGVHRFKTDKPFAKKLWQNTLGSGTIRSSKRASNCLRGSLKGSLSSSERDWSVWFKFWQSGMPKFSLWNWTRLSKIALFVTWKQTASSLRSTSKGTKVCPRQKSKGVGLLKGDEMQGQPAVGVLKFGLLILLLFHAVVLDASKSLAAPMAIRVGYTKR